MHRVMLDNGCCFLLINLIKFLLAALTGLVSARYQDIRNHGDGQRDRERQKDIISRFILPCPSVGRLMTVELNVMVRAVMELD